MVDRNIINKLGLSEEKLDRQVEELFSEKENQYLEKVLQAKVDSRLPGTILKGTIVTQIGNDVIVEIGLKSEGVIDASEFDDPEEIETGREVEVILEDTDSPAELIPLSKRKADRIRGWDRIIDTKKEGDTVKGKVVRRIKGGLLVDIGVPVFLPASQVDIRKPGDISRFIGKEIESKILKIDIEGKNIVISRRKLIEEQRQSSKEKILAEIEVGQLRKGIVKNIADFGVFVDLGGIDGLLHISDLSWGRISHPSEVIGLDQEIECMVIGVDKESEKVSLGMKQKTQSPWKTVEQNYPVGTRVKGKVVNVMNYGVFIRLENGIEGLVHISEMSWTKRLSHPNELLNLGDEIEVVVLSVSKDKHEISLGLKQTETNPWTIVSQKYPVGAVVTAKVRSVTNFGVFVEIEEGIDGMIHISDLSWTRKYNHPSEAVKPGEDIKCIVLDINEEKRRVSLGIKQITEDPWLKAIPEKYIPGHIIKGIVTKITNFGAFVELEPELEGLLHISEIADHKIDSPQDVIQKKQEIEVKILKVDTESRKIGLSLRRAQWAAEEKADSQHAQVPPSGIQTVLSGSQLDPSAEDEQKAEETKAPEKQEQQTEIQSKPADFDQIKDAAETEQPQETKEPEQPADDTPDSPQPEDVTEKAETEQTQPEETKSPVESTESQEVKAMSDNLQPEETGNDEAESAQTDTDLDADKKTDTE